MKPGGRQSNQVYYLHQDVITVADTVQLPTKGPNVAASSERDSFT